MPENGQMEEGSETHVCRKARAARLIILASKDDCVVRRLHGDVRDTTTPRAAQMLS